jgi:opacity protein-like surface antigen
MHGQKMILLAFVFAGLVPCARAQRQFEITPFGGARFGGNIDFSQQNNAPNDSLNIASSEDYGVMAGVSFWTNFEGEFMWNRQPTELRVPGFAGPTGFVSNMNFDMYQFDGLYQFRDPEAKLRPFIVAGLGFSHYGGQDVLGFSNRFAYNVGGGVKYFFTPHVGVRAEVRLSPSLTTQGYGTYCSPYYGCYTATVSNQAYQGQANLGIVFRFGK